MYLGEFTLFCLGVCLLVGIVVSSGCLYNCCNSVVGTCISVGVCLYLWVNACNSVDDYSCVCVCSVCNTGLLLVNRLFVVVSLRDFL